MYGTRSCASFFPRLNILLNEKGRAATPVVDDDDDDSVGRPPAKKKRKTKRSPPEEQGDQNPTESFHRDDTLEAPEPDEPHLGK